MKINFIGEYPAPARVLTDFPSIDIALDDGKEAQGFPVGINVEMYGNQGIGKTSSAVSLAGVIARKLKGDVAIADFEGQDRGLLESCLTTNGFKDGNVYMLADVTDEKVIDSFLEKMTDKTVKVGILDSIGAISPISELEGSTADSNMGRRAQLIAKLTRRLSHIHAERRNEPAVCFMLNHSPSDLKASMYSIPSTPGGKTKDYLSRVRIQLVRINPEYDCGWVLEGRVKKLTFGPSNRIFHVFVLAGKGLHPGMSAVMDCIYGDIATADRNIVKIGSKSYGHINSLSEKWDDPDAFKPFYDALYGPERAVDGPKPKKAGKRAKKA